MPNITQALEDVQAKASAALQRTAADNGASPVLTAVMREFASKCDKALAITRDGKDTREAVVELDRQVTAAAQADGGAEEATRSLVVDAHLAICVLKAETG